MSRENQEDHHKIQQNGWKISKIEWQGTTCVSQKQAILLGSEIRGKCDAAITVFANGAKTSWLARAGSDNSVPAGRCWRECYSRALSCPVKTFSSQRAQTAHRRRGQCNYLPWSSKSVDSNRYPANLSVSRVRSSETYCKHESDSSRYWDSSPLCSKMQLGSRVACVPFSNTSKLSPPRSKHAPYDNIYPENSEIEFQ